jgi:hypothetical protein
MFLLLSAIALRCRRARSWLRRAKGEVAAPDLDARFIFLWIALNALFGQAKYRQSADERTAEFKDLTDFVKSVDRLDRGAVQKALRDPQIRERVKALLDDRYLDNKCWQRWDENGITDKTARESCCIASSDRPELVTLLSRLYVLRNHIFHGCSTDRSSRNRPSLMAAVPVLEKLVHTFIGVVEVRGSGEAIMARPPYPPSQVSRR